MGLPELERHAARERAMAIAYFERWAPESSEELWRQSLWILDALNAALLREVVGPRAIAFAGGAMWSALTSRDEWQRFVAAMEQPLAI
jgi:hypothetical protein